MSATTPVHRSFAGRVTAVLIGEVVSKGSVMIAFAWLTRTLDASVYGEVEWALSLMVVSALAADAGLSTWGAAQVAARPEEAAALAGRIGALRLVLAVPAYAILAIVAASYGGAAGITLAVDGLALFLTPFFLQYLFNGLFQSGWAALGNGLRGLTFAAVVLLFVRPGSPPWIVALAELAGAAALAACSLVVLTRTFRLAFPMRASRPTLGGVLRQSWPVGAAEMTWGVRWYAGLILLGYLATTTDAAWHSAALRLVMAAHTVVWLYLFVLLPNLARVLSADGAAWRRLVEQSLRLTGWLGSAIAVAGTLAAQTSLVTVFGDPYVAAVPALQVMIWVVPAAWITGHLKYSLVAAQHQDKDYQAGLIGAVAAVVLTIVLMPSLGSTGTALALIGGTTTYGLAAWIFVRQRLPRFALAASVAPGAVGGLGCAALGFVLRPLAGELGATAAALVALVAIALVAERARVREVLKAMTSSSGLKPKVSTADARS